MAQIPLLIMSDAPTSTSGLGRITRDLAVRIHEHLSDVFRVGTFGYGGLTSRHLGFKQYQITRLENHVAPELPVVWKDFAGDNRGILLAIWNPGWLSWLGDSQLLPPSVLRGFLEDPPFRKWIYSPIDGVGVGGKMQASIVDILSGFSRVLFYTEWAAQLYDQTVRDDDKELWEAIPHGIDGSIFYPRDATEARKNFVASVSGRHLQPLRPDLKMIGIVATNSARKDWGLAFEACAQLLADGMNIGIWAHTDYFQKHWDLVGMANEFGLAKRILMTNGSLNDETMAMAYSGCDVTLGIGSGEGYGYPIAESLACGTPVIHGSYAGGSELVPPRFQVDQIGHRWDGGVYFAQRPVFDPEEWALKIISGMASKTGKSLLAPEYYWKNLWPRWEAWLTDGVNG